MRSPEWIKGLLVFSLLNGLNLTIQAQVTILHGTVSDAIGKDRLVAATVQCAGEGTFTDNQGRFVMEVPPGMQELSVSYVGFETYNQTLEIAGDSFYVEIPLKPSASLLG
ncbi:MAG: carboxypeptidase-like regulatory domain-containing protein, partial [Saprospiraceae bacterium]|nr:carboxypeptidase-like regulatory domain-containing protein [Saprospiraceae bacterium]